MVPVQRSHKDRCTVQDYFPVVLLSESTLQKIPFMIIIGEKETKSNLISIRTREGKDLGSIEVNKFINQLKSQIETFS